MALGPPISRLPTRPSSLFSFQHTCARSLDWTSVRSLGCCKLRFPALFRSHLSRPWLSIARSRAVTAFLSGMALTLICLGLSVFTLRCTQYLALTWPQLTAATCSPVGRKSLVQPLISMGLPYFMRPTNPHYLRLALLISRRPSVLGTLLLVFIDLAS